LQEYKASQVPLLPPPPSAPKPDKTKQELPQSTFHITVYLEKYYLSTFLY